MFLKMMASRAGIATLLVSASLLCTAQTAPAAKWQASRLDNGTRYLSYSATAPLLGKPTAFMVNFFCYPLSTKTEKGMLGIEIHVDNVATLKPFQFDSFEGPDAATNGRKLLRIEVNNPDKPTYVVDSLVSGWIPDTSKFAFGISEESQRIKSSTKTVLRALADDADSLKLTITDPRNPKLQLEFTVPVANQRAEFKTLLTGLK
jgi:hypothetical protein